MLAAKVWGCYEVLPPLVQHAGHWENQETVGAAVLTNEGQNGGGGYSQMRPDVAFLPVLCHGFSAVTTCVKIAEYFNFQLCSDGLE